MGLSIPVAVTGTGVVVGHKTTFYGFSIFNNDAAAVTVHMYDHASAASGTIISYFICTKNSTEDHHHFSIPNGLVCVNGIYLSSTGTIGGSVYVG